MNRRLLIAFAHPDDESFGLGALIAHYVAAGVEVYYLCATDGDAGTVSPELLEGYASVAELRVAELDKASAILGFKQVFRLGYRNSGMMRSPDNDHPDSLWYTWTHTPEAVIRRVVEVIREVRPQVVITFNRYGGYGHPDHIAIQRATTEAFSLAGDDHYLTAGLAAYAPQKLYYNNIPLFILNLMVRWMKLRGKDPRNVGRNADIDLQAILDNVEPIHARVVVGRYIKQWQEASACHVSQGGGRAGFAPMWVRKLLGVRQGFTRVCPVPARDTVDERDLFANVRVDEPVVKPTP
jgi:N-acetyl-1-D-myo-inositol-2-amino-2-deoxy-alpha-D-glucopyranoside deacetylase/mycothiol S-conjugate amidase